MYGMHEQVPQQRALVECDQAGNDALGGRIILIHCAGLLTFGGNLPPD